MKLINRMLDLLPKRLFKDPNTKFLDPCCKTGVFLREIAKRLLKNQHPGYEDRVEEINQKKSENRRLSAEDKFFMNELQKTVDHIFHEQLFGIAITEITSLVSRRSVYCIKSPDSYYSISKFENADGNIRFKRVQHTWKNGKCVYCGAKEELYSRGDDLESHAYEWIHTDNLEGIFNMKFDVIIGNPPYHLNDGGNGKSAVPIYQHFIDKAKRLNPRFMSMIIPAKWYAGGKYLDDFREDMLNDNRIRVMKDYVNSKDCFGSMSVGGGVCYFLWGRDHRGTCNYTSVNTGKESVQERRLNEFPVFVRYNEAVSIIHKVQRLNESTLANVISSRNPFDIPTNARGEKAPFENAYTLVSSQGDGFIRQDQILKNKEIADSYKVMVTRVMSEHAGEPDKNGQLSVLATIRVLNPRTACTDSYVVGGCFKTQEEADNLASYLKTKFARCFLLQSATTINLSRETYRFVPLQDFTKSWTDTELYDKYGLSKEERDFVESMIKPMDVAEE